MINTAFNAGVNGIQKGLQDFAQAADDITKAGTTFKDDDVGDMAKSLVDMKVSELQVEASAAVVESASEILGTTIDVRA